MKSPAALLSLGFFASGTMALAQVGPVWVRVVGGGAIMFLILLLVQSVADLQKKIGRAEEKDVAVMFDVEPVSKKPTVQPGSKWRH